MSDYIFHPRLEARADMWAKKYYQTAHNPYYNDRDIMTEFYAWGRFWEVYDLYLENQPAPTNLGYIEEKATEKATGTVTTVYNYENSSYWYEASNWDDEDSSYIRNFYNTDTYPRSVAGHLGDIVIFSDVTYEYGVGYLSVAGVVEKEPSNDHGWLISFYLEDEGFIVLESRDQYDIDWINGETLPFIGAIENPIWQMYDNIIAGHPLYWRFPVWLYKKIIDKRRGL